MSAVKVYELTGKRALITRESAEKIGHALAEAWDGGEQIIDFAEVDAVTPSFVDQILAMVESLLRDRGRPDSTVVFLHPPTRLSEKFSAVGRAHRLRVTESEDGTWVITPGMPVP